MKTRAEIEARLRELLAKVDGILDKAKQEKRSLSDEEQSEVDKHNTEMDGLEERLTEIVAAEDRQKKHSDRRARLRPTERPEESGDDPAPTEDRTNYHGWPVEEADQFFSMVRCHYTMGRQVPESYHSAQEGRTIRFNPELRQTFLEQRAPTGLGTIIDQEGGFLIPTTIAAGILQKMHQEGQVLSRCQAVPITVGNSTTWNSIIETSRTSGNRYGGITVSRTGEAVAASGSKPKTNQIQLQLKKFTALVYLTEELMEDGPQAMTIVNDLVPRAFRFAIEDEIINGTGGPNMIGVLNSAPLVTVAKETNQTAATIVFDNVLKMLARLWSGSMSNAVWFINQDTLPQLVQLSIQVGTGGSPVWLAANSAAGPLLGTLFGRPVISIEHCATLGTVGDIILGDFSQYLLASKGGLRTAQSMHVKFAEGETAFRFMLRNDGKPWWSSALTPAKGSNTQSPFIVLDTRA